jgi:hypothetical protein
VALVKQPPSKLELLRSCRINHNIVALLCQKNDHGNTERYTALSVALDPVLATKTVRC